MFLNKNKNSSGHPPLCEKCKQPTKQGECETVWLNVKEQAVVCRACKRAIYEQRIKKAKERFYGKVGTP